ncbi:MAG: PRD domain-containing protein [Candidatus Izemoplasmatales bacterium]
MSDSKYLIEKVLNNNSIIAKDSLNESVILIGKGIGFNKKVDQYFVFNDGDIERSFYNFDKSSKNQIVDMIRNYDEEIIDISNDIIKLAEKRFGVLNQHVFVSLTDHLNFAIDRLRNDFFISNPFAEQIPLILFQEYEVALEAKKIIKDRINIDIPEEEVGFIAFHINSAREHIKVNNVVLEMRLYKDIVRMVEEKLNIKLDQTKGLDLYFIIQSFIQTEKVIFQFLEDYLDEKIIASGTKKQELTTIIIDYLEEQLDKKLDKSHRKLLYAYINSI